VESIRAKRPIWVVARFEQDEEGRDDACSPMGEFRDREAAVAELDRLRAASSEPSHHFELIEAEANVVLSSR
jgi:hypothetical protein